MGAPPLLVELRGNSLDDGPGIRTVVFFKGCPLSCDWCHNPEASSAKAELSWDDSACIGGRECVAVCEPKALDASRPGYVVRELCTLCFACAEVCPTGALTAVGRAATVDEIVAAVARYEPFYRASGGGVTLSGGEPTLHLDFCGELAAALSARGVHTLLETSGHFDLERFLERIDPYVDEIYFDVKVVDEDAHRRHCGASNERSLANLRALVERARHGGTPVLPRIALVPDRTATDENLAAAARLLAESGARRVALLDYNPLWHEKARRLGAEPRYGRTTWLTRDEKARARSFFGAFEIVA